MVSLNTPRFPVPTSHELASKLDGLNIELGEQIAPGAVSEVYAGRQGDQSVVVKFTSDKLADRMPGNSLPHETHYVDVAILRYLGASSIRVPKVLHAPEDQPLTVMEDLRAAGFSPLRPELEQSRVPIHTSAENIGHGIGLVQEALGKNKEIQPALPRPDASAIARMPSWALNARQKVHMRYASDNPQLTWIDPEPSNIFVNPDGKAAFIDFGFSSIADRDYTISCCLSCVAVLALRNDIPKDEAASFISRAVAAYREVLPVDDEVLTTYLASEVIDYGEGDWMADMQPSQRQNLLQFGKQVFRDELFSLDAVTSLLRRVR